ncbi:unnamed protein product, partial [Amoebophrya sp. A25]|eukprot:GSA25T00008373001.1
MAPLLALAGALALGVVEASPFLARRDYPTKVLAAPGSSSVPEMRGRYRAPDVNKTDGEVAHSNGVLQIREAPAAWNETKADAVGHGDGFFQLSDPGEKEAAHPGQIKWVHPLETQTVDDKKALEGLCKHGKYMVTRVFSKLANGFQAGDCVKRLGKYSRLLQYEGVGGREDVSVWLAVFWQEKDVVEFYLLPEQYSTMIIKADGRRGSRTWSGLWGTYTRLVIEENRGRPIWRRLAHTTSVTKPIPALYSPRGLAFRFQLGLSDKLPRRILEICENQNNGRVAKVLGMFSKARVAMLKTRCALQLSPYMEKVISEYISPGDGPRGILFPGAEDTNVIREALYEKGGEEGG